MDYALLYAGSSFTVGVAEEAHLHLRWSRPAHLLLRSPRLGASRAPPRGCGLPQGIFFGGGGGYMPTDPRSPQIRQGRPSPLIHHGCPRPRIFYGHLENSLPRSLRLYVLSLSLVFQFPLGPSCCQGSRLLRPGGRLSRLLRPGGRLSRLLRPGGHLSRLLRPGGRLSRLLRPGGRLSRLLRPGGHLSRLLRPGGHLTCQSHLTPPLTCPSHLTPPLTCQSHLTPPLTCQSHLTPFDPACRLISSLSAACPDLCIAPVADSALPSLHLLLSLFGSNYTASSLQLFSNSRTSLENSIVLQTSQGSQVTSVSE